MEAGGGGVNRFLWEFFTINKACYLIFTNPFILMSHEIQWEVEELVSLIRKVPQGTYPGYLVNIDTELRVQQR